MNPKVRAATEFLKQNLNRDLTLGEVCKVAGLRSSRLCELFQIEFALSPLQYHKMLRLDTAAQRLANSLNKVEVIIIELGYDRRQFFRDFKVRFGLTPAQYRVENSSRSGPKMPEEK